MRPEHLLGYPQYNRVILCPHQRRRRPSIDGGELSDALPDGNGHALSSRPFRAEVNRDGSRQDDEDVFVALARREQHTTRHQGQQIAAIHRRHQLIRSDIPKKWNLLKGKERGGRGINGE
ncbi:hypothetical protein VB757_06650 [Synechococcus sp. BA-132 BA5]|nr:hypothetical protein [Synechococcus sp. BA-132 BA5]MEA5414796.1 hypothetical protein [Synechococcus sp. BA-132 BA5]